MQVPIQELSLQETDRGVEADGCCHERDQKWSQAEAGYLKVCELN